MINLSEKDACLVMVVAQHPSISSDEFEKIFSDRDEDSQVKVISHAVRDLQRNKILSYKFRPEELATARFYLHLAQKIQDFYSQHSYCQFCGRQKTA